VIEEASMTRFTKWWFVALLAGALALAAGCEKRPTGLDPDPNRPEGVTTSQAMLVGYRNQALRVMIRDYASTNIDSVVVGVSAFPGPATMPLLLLFDATQSNQFEMYRRDSGGRFQRTTDFDLDSHFKYVSAGVETYFTTDPAPGTHQPPTYLGRGVLNGIVTHESPLTNEALLTQTDLPPITYNGQLFPTDSLFTISWVAVDGAAGYWIHAYEKPIAASQRMTCSLPAPLSYLTAGDMLIGYMNGNNPGGTMQYKLGSPGLLTLRYNPPILGTPYFVRITAVDATGQVIAQTPGDLDSLNITADLAYLAPPEFSPDKTKMFFSIGGPAVQRRKLGNAPALVAGPSGSPGTEAPTPMPSGTLERHVAPVMFPAVTPWHGKGAFAGHR
jgi:hypothetical protein